MSLSAGLVDQMCADCLYKKLQEKPADRNYQDGWCYLFRDKPTGVCLQYKPHTTRK